MGRTDVVCCTEAYFLNGATGRTQDAPTHGPATPTRAGPSPLWAAGLWPVPVRVESRVAKITIARPRTIA